LQDEPTGNSEASVAAASSEQPVEQAFRPHGFLAPLFEEGCENAGESTLWDATNFAEMNN